ncbi:MAG: hypothetical protein ACI86H_002709 [bacterium]|jgi:hypothetical protein
MNYQEASKELYSSFQNIYDRDKGGSIIQFNANEKWPFHILKFCHEKREYPDQSIFKIVYDILKNILKLQLQAKRHQIK